MSSPNPRTLLGFLAFFSILIFARATAPEPAWWSNGVIDTNPANPPDNWAMANVGQLKNVATKARTHVDATLGTTQTDWDAAYAPDPCPLPFSTTADTDNYSPVAVGQLKFVAAGFYRLLLSKAPGYDVSVRLQALGVSSSAISGSGPYFPWSATTEPGENFAPATIGQLKVAFSFDLTGVTPDPDTDHNDLSDPWEQHYFGHLGANPGVDSDSDGVLNAQEYITGSNPVDFYNGRAFALNTISAGPTTVAYTYDASGRVTLADYGAGQTIQFSHSAASNLTSITSSGIAAGGSIVTWRTAHGLPADGTGDGSDTAILAGDGLPNMAKYAFGLDPHTAMMGDCPAVALRSVSGSDFLTLSYSRPEPAASDLTYRVEVSSDNGATWTSGTGATVDVSTTINSGTATVVVRDATVVGSPTLGRRIRVMIERRTE